MSAPATKPKRYEVSRVAIWIDRAMQRFIKIGGIGVVAAVFAIFIFILWQVIPLFSTAHVRPAGSWELPTHDYLTLASDDNGEMPYLLDRTGSLCFWNTTATNVAHQFALPLADSETITATAYHARQREFLVGTSLGRVFSLIVSFSSSFTNSAWRVEPDVHIEQMNSIAIPGYSVVALDANENETHRLIAVAQRIGDTPRFVALPFERQHSLITSNAWTLGERVDLSDQLLGMPTRILIGQRADSIVVATDNDSLQYFFRSEHALSLLQTWKPFEGSAQLAIADFLFGDDSIVLANTRGENKIFSLYEHGGQSRLFGQTKVFPLLDTPPLAYSRSQRNKTFLIAGGQRASLRYATTESVRWDGALPFTVQLAALGPKNNAMWFLDSRQRLHRYSLNDPHPEAGFRAFFGKVWYEGSSEPKYEWQSTGASDDAEPKLSMIPLLIGTLKGTFYAMLLAAPLALFAALYASQFAHPKFKQFIKPTMEVMASLPSVILGFLAALWLAPLLDQRIPSLALALVFLPVSALLFGALLEQMPYSIRRRIKPGFEFIAILPLLALAAYAAWRLGPVMESAFFIARDLSTGEPIPDFRLWWVQTTGLPFEQRNALVVGFMMGFAVIPIIFTMAEDALSNVPPAFSSSSLALGASRWQTTIRVILPTASAGIFSALMIGLGRAVGETMIVLMATGNTPITGWNIFSGMRTLSANLAVELPEAPLHSTLYRTLFLGALLLFLLTFIVNTLAEIIRNRLREKYKAV